MDVALTIPTVETERLRLRAPQPEDFETYAAFRMGARSETLGGPFTRAQAFHQFCALTGHWMMRGYGRWIVTDKANGTPLGVVGLYFPESWPEPEIGWSVFDHAEGKGIAFEAATAARCFAYETLGWATVMSGIVATNTRSQALARRMGAKPDGGFDDPTYGRIDIWRHRPPKECL